MGKRKHKRESDELYAQLLQSSAQSLLATKDEFRNYRGERFIDMVLAASEALSSPAPLSQPKELRMMKKFRFQLLHRWMLANIAPCRMADVGGGKGLMSYLFRDSHWSATVIDPVEQTLPTKYKDLGSKKRTVIAATEQVTRINSEFEPALAKDFDLLVAMHAHGCNIQMIEAALQFDCELIILPCCVIHEPILPPVGVPWIQWLLTFMIEKGLMVVPFRLNFKGQNIGFYARPQVDATAVSPNL